MKLLAWSRTAPASREHSSSITKRRNASSFEEYWLASKAWERRGLTAAAAGALVHSGFLNSLTCRGRMTWSWQPYRGSAEGAWPYCTV